MHRHALLIFLFVVIAAPAAAQDSLTDSPQPRALRPVLGLRVGPPLRAAFNLGLALGHYEGPHGAYVGTAVIAEAGSGGGQLSLARVAGSPFGSGRLQLSVLRTWDNPQWVAPGQTYVGVEARMMVGIGVGIGLFGRVAGTTRGDGRLIVINLVAGI
jgi:hypothetical protein